MSMKVLVIAGVAVALGAGAYVGGVAYTKSTGESLAQKNFYKVDEALRDYKIPLKIEDKGSESSGFSSSVHTYELSSKEGGASFPVHVHNCVSALELSRIIIVLLCLEWFSALQIQEDPILVNNGLAHFFRCQGAPFFKGRLAGTVMCIIC